MIDLDFIERLIRDFDDSGVDTLEVERGGTRIKLSKSPPFAPTPFVIPLPAPGTAAAPLAPAEEGGAPERAPPPPGRDLIEVTSPMVGTFYRAPAPDAPPYVEPGKHVSPGDTLCIIEAMKLMNEIKSEVAGRVIEVLIENGSPVEFNQPLFVVEPH
ncbi:MAG: acetyl-CoA carboxylase biotin carboxyl carrier protein [Elusimicrobia bacterium]|nr:acetyl-CoA carboxylase biotin carboxyl carrier protein [Elusimicrobiota bacterium]